MYSLKVHLGPVTEISLNEKGLLTPIVSISLVGESEINQTITNRSLC